MYQNVTSFVIELDILHLQMSLLLEKWLKKKRTGVDACRVDGFWKWFPAKPLDARKMNAKSSVHSAKLNARLKSTQISLPIDDHGLLLSAKMQHALDKRNGK